MASPNNIDPMDKKIQQIIMKVFGKQYSKQVFNL